MVYFRGTPIQQHTQLRDAPPGPIPPGPMIPWYLNKWIIGGGIAGIIIVLLVVYFMMRPKEKQTLQEYY